MPSTRSPAVLSFVSLLLAASGCAPAGGALRAGGTPGTEVPLRADGTPGPEKCSEEALKTMRILRMYVGDAADVSLDANQIDARPITLYEGAIESFLDESLGTLDPGTRLYGRVWTTGPLVVVRYYAAKPPSGGDTLPICAVARMGRGQMRKKPESLPGTAILDYPGALAFVVDDFR